MAKIWSEPLDPARHVDHFYSRTFPRTKKHDGELAYFVRVAGFTFEFVSVAQIRECLEWFSTPIHPSSRLPNIGPEKGEWQPWHSRLPAAIKKGSRRERVIAAMRQALVQFDTK